MTDNGKLTRILLEQHGAGRSGVLRFERGREKKQLVILQGRLAFAESSLPGEHLAEVMVRQGAFPKPSLKEIASVMKGGRSLEEAILSLAGMGTREVEQGRREQALSILASLWAWKDYALHFYAGEDLIRGRQNLSLPLTEALVASARRAVSARLVAVPTGFPAGGWSLAGEMATAARDLPFDPGETAGLAALAVPAKYRKTAELLPLLQAASPHPEETVLRLALLGFIRFHPGDEAPPASPAANPPPVPVPGEKTSSARELENLRLSFDGGTLYDILGVPPDAGPEAIKAAYHNLARRYHPDRFQSEAHAPDVRATAQQVFASINEAYLTLKDPGTRSSYDRRLSSGEGSGKKAANAEDENTAETLFLSGRALIARGEFEQAVERLMGSVWLRPEKALYQHTLGTAEAHLPRLRKSAEGHLLKAIELDPLRPESRLELARLYLEIGLRRKAETQLEEVMRWDPANRGALRLRDELRRMPR